MLYLLLYGKKRILWDPSEKADFYFRFYQIKNPEYSN